MDNKRLYWQCRRGMLEVDVLLRRFLDQKYQQLTQQQQADFQRLLKENDQQLFDWFTAKAHSSDPALAEIIRLIRGE